MGKNEWFIPDMFWPEIDQGEYVSHEAVCVLNTGKEDCCVEITLYFEDRNPIRCRKVVCRAERTTHIRMDRMVLEDGTAIPRGVGYAARIAADRPVYVQYTRVDTTQAPLALMTTMCC